VRPILEYGVACRDPCREGQINALDRVEKKVAKFINHTSDSVWKTLAHSVWKTLAQRSKIARTCALFKTNSGERERKATGDRLQRPCYLSSGDQDRKIGTRKQRTDIEKYSFVNRTIKLWNQLPAGALVTLLVIFFYVLLTVHFNVTLVNDQLDAQFIYFIIRLLQLLHVSSNIVVIIRRSNYINTASGIVPLCKWPSGAPDGHLRRVTIPDAVLIQFDLLMMSTTLLETCRGLNKRIIK